MDPGTVHVNSPSLSVPWMTVRLHPCKFEEGLFRFEHDCAQSQIHKDVFYEFGVEKLSGLQSSDLNSTALG